MLKKEPVYTKNEILSIELKGGKRRNDLRRAYNKRKQSSGKYTIFVISLNTPLGRERRSRLNYTYTHVPGLTYKDAPDWIKRKFKKRVGNLISKKKLHPRIGCFASHMKALSIIVRKKLNRVIICEDDAIMAVKKLPPPSIFPTDGACLVGGQTLSHPKSWGKNSTPEWRKTAKMIEKKFRNHKIVRKIDYDTFRWNGNTAIYYPTWKVAKHILNVIKNQVRQLTHVDLTIARHRLVKYIYPYLFNHDDQGKSQLGDEKRDVIRGFQLM